jgi:hypothetical protein
MNPHSCAHFIFDKVSKNIQWRKDSLFNKCCWEKWLSACRKLKLDPCLLPCASINSNGHGYIRPQTLVQKRARNTLESTGIGNNFFSRTPVAQQLKDAQMGLHEIKKILYYRRNGL